MGQKYGHPLRMLAISVKGLNLEVEPDLDLEERLKERLEKKLEERLEPNPETPQGQSQEPDLRQSQAQRQAQKLVQRPLYIGHEFDLSHTENLRYEYTVRGCPRVQM